MIIDREINVINKLTTSEYGKTYYQKNKEKLRKYRRKYHSNHKDKAREYKLKNKDKIKEANRLYRLNNPHIKNNANAIRRAIKLNATPKFANIKKIKEIYKNCPKGFHVDHIIPLKNKLVCGLHVEWNLQYLPAKENLSKSNKLM
jgi:uncharacterized protein YccT (UPF0319 family)